MRCTGKLLMSTAEFKHIFGPPQIRLGGDKPSAPPQGPMARLDQRLQMRQNRQLITLTLQLVHVSVTTRAGHITSSHETVRLQQTGMWQVTARERSGRN